MDLLMVFSTACPCYWRPSPEEEEEEEEEGYSERDPFMTEDQGDSPQQETRDYNGNKPYDII